MRKNRSSSIINNTGRRQHHNQHLRSASKVQNGAWAAFVTAMTGKGGAAVHQLVLVVVVAVEIEAASTHPHLVRRLLVRARSQQRLHHLKKASGRSHVQRCAPVLCRRAW